MTLEPFQMAEQFHDVFDPSKPAEPTAFTAEKAGYRAGFKVEELVELLYGASGNDEEVFERLVIQLHEAVDIAKAKVLGKKQPVEDSLVAQVDALTDLLYFTYGSFSLIGVDPAPIMQIVHEANMGKVFADGQPHYHPVTHKVLKPDDWQERYAPEPKIKQALEEQKKAAKETDL